MSSLQFAQPPDVARVLGGLVAGPEAPGGDLEVGLDVGDPGVLKPADAIASQGRAGGVQEPAAPRRRERRIDPTRPERSLKSSSTCR